ncbi:MAG: hypothetical protein K6T71_00025 [Candidatus Bipolaricaulota bacterium]|nr:hypothetical protein [Candidatus Bipolaricaulota bacterium]
MRSAREAIARIEPIMPTTWSAYVGYLVLTGIPLLMALPSSARIDALSEPRLSMVPIFVTAAIALFTIYSLNFGPAHAKLRRSPQEIHTSLLGHVGFLMVLSLPYWTVFVGISGLPLARIAVALFYLVLYGSCWALIGLAIGLRWPSEITQFNIKYALLIVSVIGTFFALRPLNPFLVLSLWFGEGSLKEQWGFLLLAYGSLGAGIFLLLRWTATLLNKRDQDIIAEGGTL